MQQLAQRYRVSAMPTFKFIKGGKEVDEVRLGRQGAGVVETRRANLVHSSKARPHPSSMPRSHSTPVPFPPKLPRAPDHPRLAQPPSQIPSRSCLT